MKNLFTTVFALLAFMHISFGQFTGSYSYDFRDGTIISNGQSDDGSLTLAGNYSHHSTDYGLNMKVDGTITISVDGSCTVRFLGSQYSGLNLVGTAVTEGDLGTQNTQVENNLSDTYDFVYSGVATTLTFTTTAGSGNDLYLPLITIIPAQAGKDVSSPETNIAYYFDLRDESIVPSSAPGNTTIEEGLFKIEAGCCNAYAYHGTQHGIYYKDGNKITLQVAGNSYIRLGGDQYSGGTVTASSSTGDFDVSSQSHQTGSTYADNAPVWVDFMYVGDAGTVELTSSGSTNYLPYIEVSPIPYTVSLNEYVQKSGTITVNGVDINLTSGATSADNATVTVSAGEVISALTDEASIRIDLGGNSLSSYTPTFSGDIADVAASNDSLLITYANESSMPHSFIIKLADNSVVAEAEAGKTYSYNFADGSELPQNTTIKYTSFYTNDNLVNIASNGNKEFWYHDNSHGVVCYDGNSYNITVAGDAIITFVTCTYSAAGSIFTLSDSEGTELGTMAAENNGGDDAFAVSFSYTGPADVITATLTSGGSVYIHGLTVENAAEIETASKIEVWDFGAEQLDTTIYQNNLTVDIINSWYDESITVGSSGNVLPSSFTAGALSWVGAHNDRLRTSNTNITRYDENLSSVDGFTGRIYVNSAGATGRYMSLALNEDDQVTLWMLTQNGGGEIHFEYVADPEAQNDIANVPGEITEVKFVAKAAGTYHIYDSQDKPSYYRIYRQGASYQTISGNIDVSQAPDLPDNYSILFTNEAGKEWTATVDGTSYSIVLPAGKYELSLADANGYIISSGKELEVTDSTATHNISIVRVELYTLSGSLTGLGDKVDNLGLTFTPDPELNKIFVPEPEINTSNSTYSVLLEPDCEYTISASGVNDYYIPSDKLTIGHEDTNADIVFENKQVYAVFITTNGITSEQKENLSLNFANLNEEGYFYEFGPNEAISLRDGTYSISYSGLDVYPVELELTSNLVVSGEVTTKTLDFKRVTNWPFNDKTISNGDPSYKGLLFTGNVSNEVAKGHLSAKPDATIQVPVKAGEKIIVSYYYTADFSIEGGEQITTSSKSTSVLESAEYIYPESEDGFVTITIGSGQSTTYITNIEVQPVVDYASEITVGVDKEYQTVNEALAAIRQMNRPNNERVTVMIDPGNYEEMLVIDMPNISLTNASLTPDIAITNKGVDISDNAVRITSYYGHGYSYYSMGDDQKWNGKILQVNKENGYLSYVNKGAGTTNGSYWNATVVVSAEGFEANDIIFENSFNQYISKKESEDVVVEWESGDKGVRPTDYGNTDVQDRSFVERGAAIAVTGSADKVILNKCRVVGRQDSFFGSGPARVVIYRGAMMGAVDYIFGGMVAVFYKTDLVMNTSDVSSDAAYLTAAQQSSGRGYLMYDCTVTSSEPGTETASTYRAKPGYFGRPWQANTSEVVFFNTTIETSDYPGYENKSLISPEGWKNTLGGESEKMYEYGTIEESGEDNFGSRASWSTLLTEPTLSDDTEITTYNFTKGDDGWDPLSELIANDPTGINQLKNKSDIDIKAYGGKIHLSNVSSNTRVEIFGMNGNLIKTFETKTDTNFNFKNGLWIVRVFDEKGQSAKKVFLQ